MVVEDGAAALEAYEVGRFDLVMTDMAMPGMSGADLLEALHERCPEQRTILMTGHAPDDVRSRLRPDVGILLKPFHPSDLLEKLDAVFTGSGRE